jgi:hypothetical protein
VCVQKDFALEVGSDSLGPVDEQLNHSRLPYLRTPRIGTGDGASRGTDFRFVLR